MVATAMRVAVISDVHGNQLALEAVLAEVEREAPDALWCLGDLVGYGPHPNECCTVVARRADICLVGNHDLVALGTAGVDVNDFNPEAAAAALWTRSELTDESRAFLERLTPTATVEGVELYHASPRDPVWEYVLTPEAALAAFRLTSSDLVLVGHSHVALSLRYEDGTSLGGLARAGTEVELKGRRLLNPGSVGQPRDGDPRAAWLLLDTARRFARFLRVPYSVERTQAEIRRRGLPESLAARLALGH
jgi:diadenosine tetraphosphatase ApaH/serine/threonine PP2A family protein phosphatase